MFSLQCGPRAFRVVILLLPSGEDFQKEFEEQQAKMQSDMSAATNPAEMLGKLFSGDVGSPQKQVLATPEPGAAAVKRPKRQGL